LSRANAEPTPAKLLRHHNPARVQREDYYPVLTLAYFGEPGLPQQLLDIPLEYFRKAITLLRAQPHVDPGHVLVYGLSRGGELALLLGATFPSEVNGVIAGSPSSAINGSTSSRDGAAWTLHGTPLTPGQPIPVDRIPGPIVQACGGMDYVWPSCTYVAQVNARLIAHHFRYPVTTLRFPEGGHLVGALTCCTSLSNNDLGGPPTATLSPKSTGTKRC
jgi:hypothetical protein